MACTVIGLVAPMSWPSGGSGSPEGWLAAQIKC